MIIVIEGADGSGKTEVGRILAKSIGAKLIHFPDDDAVTGPMIRSYLRKEWCVLSSVGRRRENEEPNMSALVFQALQIANRMERMAEINQCASAQTLHVVLVRYWQSGWVYGQLDGLSRDWLTNVHTGMAKADCNILLDVDAELSMERQAARDGDAEPERYEGKLDFTKRIVNLYRELWMDVSLRAPYLRPNSPYGGLAGYRCQPKPGRCGPGRSGASDAGGSVIPRCTTMERRTVEGERTWINLGQKGNAC